MNGPKVSVIIPTYNGMTYLGAAIESVLAQTFADFELIVVNDASPDRTDDVVARFHDPRIVYLIHDHNQGADAARHTGLARSSGELIAFLDQDDRFHPDKLRAHVELFAARPEADFGYNDRFEFDYSAESIRDLWRPPSNISLADLVLWFPIAPSDVVLRREWAQRIDLLGGSLSWCGGEIVFFGELYLSGCRFAKIPRALNYRRHHSQRIIRDLVGGCESEIYAQRKIFTDPRCPEEVRALQPVAHANLYMFWAYRALAQHETEIGREFVREAVRQRPSIVQGMPGALVEHFMINAIDDETLDHEALLGDLFDQLPPELADLNRHRRWVGARGYVLKGIRAIIWDRPDDGARHFGKAVELHAEINNGLLGELAYKLLSYEGEFGSEPTQRIVQGLLPYLEALNGWPGLRALRGRMATARAFQRYAAGQHGDVPASVVSAVIADPRQLTNRGMLSILARSTVGSWIHFGVEPG